MLPLLSFGQTSADSPRFYLSAGASVLTPRPFSTFDHTLGGPMLTAGAWLGPRIALQIGGSVVWSTNDPSYSDYPVPPVGTTGSRLTVYTFPVLLRFAFLPPNKKFAIDGLGGYTLLHSASVFSLQYTSGTKTATTNRSNLTLGPSFRYSLSRHIGVTAAPLLNLNLSDTKYLSFKQSLFWNYTVGVHYSLG